MQSANGEDTAFLALPANSTGGHRKKRTKYTKEQVDILVKVFEANRYPGYELREDLASKLEVPEGQIHHWFQNRRARYPLQRKEDAIPCGTPSNQQGAPNVWPLPGGSLEGQFSAQHSPEHQAPRPPRTTMRSSSVDSGLGTTPPPPSPCLSQVAPPCQHSQPEQGIPADIPLPCLTGEEVSAFLSLFCSNQR